MTLPNHAPEAVSASQGGAPTADAAAVAPRARGARRIIKVAVLIGAAGALVWIVDLRSVSRALLSMPASLVLLAVALSFADRLLMAGKWWHLLRTGGSTVPYGGLSSAYFQACFLSYAVPTAVAPEILRVWLAVRLGAPRPAVLSSMLLERIGGVISAALLALAAVMYFSSRLDSHVTGSLLALGATLAVGAAALLGASLSAPTHGWLVRLARRVVPAAIANELEETCRSLLTYRRHTGALVLNLALAMLEHTLQFACLVVVSRALGVRVPLMPLAATIAIVMLIRRVTSQMDSWGITEGLTVITYSALALTREQAVALTIANTAVIVTANVPGGVALVRQFAGRRVRLNDILSGSAV